MADREPNDGDGADDYAVLTQNAFDALGALLCRSDPGSGMQMRGTYNDLRCMLGRDKEHDLEEQRKAEREAERQRDWDAWKVWSSTPMHERERLILEAIGENRLTMTQVAERLAADMPEAKGICGSRIRSSFMRLLDAGELERVGEEFLGKVRYRYFRKGLSGPIVDLQRQFDPSDHRPR